MPKIAVIGTTSWGTTLGVVLARKGYEVRIWARTEEEAERLSKKGPDSRQMQGTTLPPGISFTSSAKEALLRANAVIVAVPAQTMRRNISLIKPFLSSSTLIVSAAKGIETSTNKRMSQVIADEIPAKLHHNICVLSGPNLFKEILKGLPASAVVASGDDTTAKKVQRLFASPGFSVYTNNDIIGVELGGALKNVIALGAGMVDGLGYGDNAKAAFITRGLTEMAALGVALGASPLTLSGLAGLGDLIATCASTLSRNHYVGVELTKGRCLTEITSTMAGVAEGVATTAAVWDIAQKVQLEMPITERIYQVLYCGADPRQTINDILDAQGRHELTGRKWRLFSLFRRGQRRS